MAASKPYPGTQSVLRAVSLLKVFSDERPEWGLTELSQEVALNKTTTYRLLTALASEGMVSRDASTETYRLGPEVIALGGRALRSNDLRSVCRPELKKLAAQVGETASLEILSGTEILILDEVSGEYVMSGGQAIGTRWPAYATSTGKAILAEMTPEALQASLPPRLTAITPKTITSRDALKKDLACAHQQGYAVGSEELEMGLVAVAAPLRNYDGDIVGAVSLAGPTIRLTADRLPDIGRLVKETACRISISLGYRPE